MMGRKPCCDKIGLKRGPWTVEEDHKLRSFILNNGIQCWRLVPKLAGLLRCGKSCRLRWINYLRPDLKRGALTEAEEDMIIQLHSRYGNRWSKIASHFPGRTDNEIKNHWNTRIKKKLKEQGNSNNKEKETLQASSSRNQESNLELDLHDNSNSRDDQMPQRELNESLDVRSMAISETDPSNYAFSVGMDEPLHEDFLQHWMNSPNYMFSWDGFNNLEEIFL